MTLPRPLLLTTALFGSLAWSCGGSDSEIPEPALEHLYAFQTFVYQADETTLSYVGLTDTIDVEGTLDLADAREFRSYSFISSIGGKLLVSLGEAPEIIQYDVQSAALWHETGRLSFGHYGVPSYGAGWERHWFKDEHTAYLTHEVTSRIVWDPTDMVILDVKDDTALESERDALVLDAAFNRPPHIYDGPVLKPFYYRDEDWYLFGSSTAIAVYDPRTHAERAVIDAPCPALEVMSQDEDGNTYFSPWTYGPALSLFGEGPSPCVRRVKNDGTLDEDWAPELSAWTGGRPVQVLRYVGDGKAVGTVLHLDEVSGDFTSGYDEELALELDAHWRLWWFDLEAETANLIDEIGSSGSGFNLSTLGGRTFVFVPNGDWSETTAFELGPDGHGSERFRVPGLLNNWLQLR
jgi:hypothetical protein